jgi:hypothetical protein
MQRDHGSTRPINGRSPFTHPPISFSGVGGQVFLERVLGSIEVTDRIRVRHSIFWDENRKFFSSPLEPCLLHQNESNGPQVGICSRWKEFTVWKLGKE